MATDDIDPNEKYLEGDPRNFQWGKDNWQGDTGGSLKAAQMVAWKEFSSLFGRNPTQVELNMLAPAYMSGDKNLLNSSTGNQAVSEYYNNKVNSPEAQEKRREAGYLKEAPGYYDKIGGQFQSVLGRDATQEEKDHFGKMLARGEVDPYTLGQYLQQLPESVKKQDEVFRNSLRDTIKTEDSRYFGEQVMPGIQGNFAKSGRSVESSGFANALAQAAQQQNTGREDFLSSMTANQYEGNKSNAYNEYLNSVGRSQGNQDYYRARRDQLTDSASSRINQIQDFAMQKQAYDDYLNRYGKQKSSGMGGMVGGLVGTGIGAYFGGSSGAMVGNSIGSGVGNYWGG